MKGKSARLKGKGCVWGGRQSISGIRAPHFFRRHFRCVFAESSFSVFQRKICRGRGRGGNLEEALKRPNCSKNEHWCRRCRGEILSMVTCQPQNDQCDAATILRCCMSGEQFFSGGGVGSCWISAPKGG